MRLVIFTFCTLLYSCTQEMVTEYYDVTTLPVSRIYSGDSVQRFMKRIGETNKEIADSYLKKAKAARENNLEKAVYFLKRSITLHPTKEKYLGLADLFWKDQRYGELGELYALLLYSHEVKDILGKTYNEFYFGEPSDDLFYEQIVAFVAENKSLYADYTWEPRERGLDMEKMGKRLQHDPRIGMDTSSPAFKFVLLQFLDMEKLEEISKRPEMFGAYLSSTSDSALVFSIGKKDLQEFSYDRYQDDYMTIDYRSIHKFYLVEIRDQPDRWIQFETKHQLPVSKEFKTMIYAVDTSELASPFEFRHIYQRLVTYDKQNQVIDSRVIATQSGEDLMLADVNKNQITLKNFKRKFQKPYKKGDYDNEVIEVTPVQEVKIEITPEGKIQEAVVL